MIKRNKKNFFKNIYHQFYKLMSFINKFIFSQKFLALLGLIVIILICFALVKNVSSRYRINNDMKELEKEITSLENKNSNFKDLISYLESNQFVEEQARLKLGLKKEGEDVVVIENKSKNAEDNSTTTSSSIFNIPGLSKANLIDPIKNPQKWWKYFFEK